MRWLVGTILITGLLFIGGYLFLKGYPYRLYTHWIHGKGWNKYYSLENYSPAYLKPIALAEIPPYKEDYGQLWKIFPLRNAKVPLPVRHPLFQTIPLIEYTGNKKDPKFGIIILSPNDRELSRVYTLPTKLTQDYSLGQELFRLPYVRNRILKYPQDKLWKDIFVHEVIHKIKPIDQMIYDLFIMHIRSKILPKTTLRYGLIQDSKALIEIDSPDKDYIVEYVVTFESGSLYSYVLRTEKNNIESQKLRSKFLDEITFGPVDTAMRKILYTEFKQLNFARQVDQEGMLFLFSGWSQDLSNVEMLREMIFYLERGKNKGLQLRPLYVYAMKQYGKTFTTRKNFNLNDDQDLTLQRKIEIENREIGLEAAKAKTKPLPEPELTPDEKMNLYLKKAKEEKPIDKDDMTIH